MHIFPDLTQEFRELQSAGLVISPWLAGVNSNGRFDAGVFEMLDSEIRTFVIRAWTEDERLKVLHDVPAPSRIPRTATYEIVSSTAVHLAHERTGSLEVDDDLALEAFQRTLHFAENHGFGTLVQLYMTATSWENQNALSYYRSIPEREFVLGKWHRPWVDYDLGEELLFGALLGNYQIVISEGRRHVTLTDTGRAAYHQATEVLQNSGYLTQRLNMLRISQFSRFENYEHLGEEIWPHSIDLRREFLAWSQIRPGMRVLELGCANGVLTFDCGLAQLIGRTGHITGVDPSAGMVGRANVKRETLGIDWVDFHKGHAEELPFADGTFDAVIGTAFLHLTDLDQALREMKRATKPGGIVASYHPVEFAYDIDFFKDWFEPLFALSKRRNDTRPKDSLPSPSRVLRAFHDTGLSNVSTADVPMPTQFQDPDKVIAHFIEGVGWFAEELALLPWKARLDLIEELKQRGRDVCSKYTTEQLTVGFPSQMIRSTV